MFLCIASTGRLCSVNSKVLITNPALALQALLEVLRGLPDVRVALEKLADDCLDTLRKHHRTASTRQRQQMPTQQQQGRQQLGSAPPASSGTADGGAEQEQEQAAEISHLRHVRHMAGWLLAQLDSKGIGPKFPSGGGASHQ
jgi:hypothetical protein